MMFDAKLLCKLGIHGPNVFGYWSGHRSYRSEPFIRTCCVCGQQWVGEEVTNRYYRTLGNWTKVKKEWK